MNTTTLLLLCVVSICQIHFGYTKDAAHSSASCVASERRALMDFKRRLVDPANRLSSWNGMDCCNWDGITCNNLTGRVEKLDLRNPIQPYVHEYLYYDNIIYFHKHRLEGEINPSISNLQHLRYLDLSSNNFAGIQIPTFFGSMKILRYLNLTGAGFGGEIPPHLGNMSNLEYLYLGQSNFGFSYNSLTSKSLKWVAGFASLKALDLSGNNLSESLDWLDSINMLPSLSSLNLWYCNLVGQVSPSLSHFNLTSLVSFDIGLNYLKSTSLLKLFNLTSELEVLRLNDNFFEAPIPFVLEKFTYLIVLDLSGNYFNSSSILDSLCNITSLVSMDLNDNQFEGSIPVCFGNLTSLVEVHMQDNKFGGKIPSELGNLKQLTHLRLSNNSFNSSIPSSFGKLKRLKNLYLDNNQFHGTILSTLGLLTKLQALDISFNSLTGEVSEYHFMNLKCLKWLSISNNQFLTLNVSSQWITPFQLVHIDMGSVHIGTQFPLWLQTQRNVYTLSLRNTSISGAIPEWFGTVGSSVHVLDLSSNKIQGSLSGNVLYPFCNLSSLMVLHLANNQLTGRIPSCVGYLQQLLVLNLANNSLSGHIPSKLGNLHQLAFLHLNKNKFYGVLPSSLQNLNMLITLNLGENDLKDTIPDWIGKELLHLCLDLHFTQVQLFR